MSGGDDVSVWPYYKFALFVTGSGEREFLELLFRPLTAIGRCHFQVVHQLGQRSPIRSKAKALKMVGRGKKIPDKDEDIGIKARVYLSGGYSFIVLVDDLEHDRAEMAKLVFDRYRTAFDELLRPLGLQSKASVQFLVNILEAFYFADAQAVNRVLGTQIADFEGDVETIPHPKNELKSLVSSSGKGRGFDEVKDGKAIMQQLDVAKVLSRPKTCRSLRTAFAWCSRAAGMRSTQHFRLIDGASSRSRPFSLIPSRPFRVESRRRAMRHPPAFGMSSTKSDAKLQR